MRISIHLLAFASLIFGSQILQAGPLTARFLFAARMNSAQEVPSTTSSAIGVATFTYNNTGDTLCVTMTVNGLTGPITAVHIHEAPAGVIGGVIVDLGPYLQGNSLQATLTGASLSSLSRQKMFAGQYYINVHTAANGSGEIRGQIMLEEDRGMMVNLVGANEVPPVTTNARGLAFFKLSSHNQKLNIYVVLDSLVGVISGAHLHWGRAGSTGTVIQDLMPYYSGNVINATVDPSVYLDAIFKDSIYINVHTAINPQGQIRGQLHFEPYLHFDARMNGIQEVPTAATSGQGLGVFRMNYAMDSIWYDLLEHGMTGPIVSAHIHPGAVGFSQSPIVPFPPSSISGSHISGAAQIPGGTLGDSLRKMLLEGNLYANIHSTIYPAGEIRGQIYRTMREGYTFSITGDQENPAVTTSAYGSGMVSIDRDDSNAHFMIAATNITPTLAHFHKNVAGSNGGVIFNLLPYIGNNGFYGYWRENDATTPFTKAIALQFQTDSIYTNLHTAANGSGEIRGQVLRNLCTALPKGTLGVDPRTAADFNLEIIPNPVSENASVLLKLSNPVQAEVQLTDISGRIIWTESRSLNAGEQKFSVPTQQLPSGMYFLRFVAGESHVSRKLVKQ